MDYEGTHYYFNGKSAISFYNGETEYQYESLDGSSRIWVQGDMVRED